MSEIVRQANESLGPLKDGRKYCLAIPGPLGGAYDVSNLRSVGLEELIRFSGDIAKQVRDVRDGERVELKIVE